MTFPMIPTRARRGSPVMAYTSTLDNIPGSTVVLRPKAFRIGSARACAPDVIGDKWTLLIVRDLACGKSQFKDFSRSPEKIATNILTDRLNRLVEHRLVERFAMDEQPGRDAYRLTEKGRSLQPVLKAIANWGQENVPGTVAQLKPKF